MKITEGNWPDGFPPGFAKAFEPVRMVGRGSFGSVWLAKQIGLDRQVALKVLHDEVLQDEAEVGRFSDEARITASLKHPHIVVVLDHGVEVGVPWIAYEYLPGQSLRARLTADGLPWREVLSAAVQVLDALDYAHKRGILHRDIKPDNIIEVRPGHYKVADFGLAKHTDVRRMWTATGAVVGSPAYLSPEQIEGQAPEPASDQYALGVTLYELLTGKLPFYEKPDMPVMLAHLKVPPPKLSDAKPMLPKVLELIIERTLSKKPAARFASVAELKASLEAILGGESSAVMVRMRSKLGVSTKGSDRASVSPPRTGGTPATETATARLSPPGRRHRPGPIWWALAIALPLAAASYFGMRLQRARIAEQMARLSDPPSVAATARFKELTVTPHPPRAVRVQYELDLIPPAGWPLAVSVNGVARPAMKLTSVAGSVLVTGVEPGSRVRVGTRELVTPRALATWVDALPTDTLVSIFLRFSGPSVADLAVVERAGGKVVFQERTARAHHFVKRVPGLKPGTRYALRVKAADASHFIPAGASELEFTTRTAQELAPMRAELGAFASKDEAERRRALWSAQLSPDPEAAAIAGRLLAEPKVAADYDGALQLMPLVARMRDPRALPGLEAVLAAAPNPQAKVNTILHVAEVQDPAGFDIVLRACAAPGLTADEETGAAVADALLASDPVRASETFLKLSNDLAKAPPVLARAAVEGLPRLGVEDAVPALARIARVASRDLGLRATAGLGAIATDAARAALVAMIVAGARPGAAGPAGGSATEGALRALARCGREDDAGAVIALLEAPLGPRLKRAAIMALAGLGGPAAEAAIVRHVGVTDSGVALAATWAAGQLRIKAAVPAIVRELLSGTTSGRAARALGLIGDPGAEGPLFTLVTSPALLTKPGQVLDRAEALWALGVLGSKRALPELTRQVRGGDLYTRYRAIEALGWLGDAAGRGVLEEVARDPGLTLPLKEAAAKSLRWIAEGRRPRTPYFSVDPAFPPVRSGLKLAMGEGFQVEAQGVCLIDPQALAGAVDPANLPTGSRPARAALLGLVGATGHCFAGRGETAPCTRVSEGELLLYALRLEPDEKAAGFLTVWLRP